MRTEGEGYLHCWVRRTSYVNCANVCTHDFKNGRLNVTVGDSFYVSIAHYEKKEENEMKRIVSKSSTYKENEQYEQSKRSEKSCET